MTWPLVNWILSSSSSSSSSEEDDDEEISENGYGISMQEDDEQEAKNNGKEYDDVFVPTAIAITCHPSDVVTVAVPGTNVPNDMKQPFMQRNASLIGDDVKKTSNEARKLYQRLWSNEEELELLHCFLDYICERGINSHHLHQQHAALFFDKFKHKFQLGCNKSQVVEKLRRLKRKYRSLSNKINSGVKVNFRGLHDQAIFEISHKVWSRGSQTDLIDNVSDDDVSRSNPIFNNIQVKRENTKETEIAQRLCKRPCFRLKSGETCNQNNKSTININSFSDLSNLVEEIVRGCLSPIFKELLSNAILPLCFDGKMMTSYKSGEGDDEKWRKQQVLEMEVYLKRLEFMQEHIRVKLEELRSKEG